MHATVRRYDGVDEARRDELTKKVNEALIPRLSKLPGFGGYYLVEADRGVMTSISFFAAPNPSPVLPPVTRATRPFSDCISIVVFLDGVRSRYRASHYAARSRCPSLIEREPFNG